MSYLLTQMFLYMLVTFLLGLLLGWLIWRNGQSGSEEIIERLRADKADLQAKLNACMAKHKAAPQAAPAAAPVAAAPTTTTSKPKGLSAPRNGKADDLKKISGVGPKMEKLLYSLGYYHFDQIAQWSKSEVAWVDDNLEGFKGRVTRDNWQDQAKTLAKR